ncbi:alpha/beta hydrolase family protein [Alienimonas californiensis]|uniref:Carboxylesterase NlhH n=1 Tax=Alienimonas californiensis TaxID=2527989 RepID=A0A517P803_9PLAN|nr:prolyl oligopeptidase family serine peptidase [Alienimonas californiensis]QDT15511.1 Carboxylesterase NlhH [Alienimonas californiensis]
MPSLALLLAALAAPGSADVAPQHGADAAFVYKTAEDAKAGGTVDLTLHVFLPEGTTERPAKVVARPAIVFYFGGGWRGGSPGQFAPHARHLADRGMVAAVAEYRVNKTHGAGPVECVQDARAALHALRSRAEQYGVDPTRVAAGGGSAGGHLGACCGVIESFPGDPEGFQTANALALFNPGVICAPYTAPDGTTATFDRWMAGLLPEGGDERLSPIHHVDAGDPPTILFHGEKDTTVPARSVELFCEALRRDGVRAELALFPGAGHGFFNQGRDGGRPYRTTLRLTDAFFTSLGWLSEPAPAANDEEAPFTLTGAPAAAAN